MNRRMAFLIAVTIAILVVANPALAKPNFSGSWKMVVDKSDFGPMPPPEKYESVVDHSDPDMKVKTAQSGAQGDFELEFKYSTEKETTNELRGNASKSTAKWDGDALVIETKLDFQGNEIKFTERWTLSEEGKTVTIARKI